MDLFGYGPIPCETAGLRVEPSLLQATLALLDQFTSFRQRESLTIHASSGSGRMSTVSYAQSVDLRCCSLLPLDGAAQNGLGIKKLQGGHPTNYLWSQTLLNFNDCMTGSLFLVIKPVVTRLDYLAW